MILAPVTYITDSQVTPTEPAYRFYAELASDDVDEYEGMPARFCIVDVCVAINCEAAVRQTLDDKGFLREWTIIGVWQPEEEAPF